MSYSIITSALASSYFDASFKFKVSFEVEFDDESSYWIKYLIEAVQAKLSYFIHSESKKMQEQN